MSKKLGQHQSDNPLWKNAENETPEDWQPTMNLKWVKPCGNLPAILMQEFFSNTGKSKWASVPVERKCKN